MCFDPDIKLESLPVDAGYWRATPNSTTIEPCYTIGACISAVEAQAQKNNATAGRRLEEGSALALDSSSTFGDGLCRKGHTGALCESCWSGWVKPADGAWTWTRYFKTAGGSCELCTGSGDSAAVVPTVAIPVALVLAALMIFLMVVCRGRGKAIKAIEARAKNKIDSKLAEKTEHGRKEGTQLQLKEASSEAQQDVEGHIQAHRRSCSL